MQVSDYISSVKERRNDFWSKKLPIEKAGYIPGVSTLSGGFRALAGTAVVVAASISGLSYLASAPFQEGGLEKAKDGGKQALEGFCHLSRGVVESVPVIGNVAVYAFDRLKDKGSNPLLNELGYIPGVSTIAGSIRMGYGILKFAVSLIMATGTALGAPFSQNCRKWSASWIKNHARDGLLHIGRGAFESIPLIGNFFAHHYDMYQAAQKMLQQERERLLRTSNRGF